MDKQYSIGEFSKLINKSIKTLQRWDEKQLLVAHRTPSNRRYYTHSQYLEYIGKKADNSKEEKESRVYIYARVSSRNQKDDLNNQLEFLKQYANAKGMIVQECFSDIGSGLNYNRKNWNKLIDMSINGDVDKIIIAHKDRFIRFGFEWFERFLKKNNVDIVVVNNEKLSPQEELVQDLISIIHVFSCRIYGLRKYKKELSDDFKKANKEKEI